MSADADLAALALALLEPVPGAAPAGRDIRYEGDFERIAEARRDEKPGLPRGVWVRDVKHADWRLAARLCAETLAERSKDLRVACWLCEAWVHVHGFPGLAHGLALITGLCERYWDSLHPQLEREDASARMAAIEWLNSRLPAAVRQVPVIADAAEPGRVFTWTDQVEALRLETVRLRDPQAAQRAEANGAATLALIDACLARTGSAELVAARDALVDARAALAALDAVVDRRCARDAPGLSAIRRVVTEILEYTNAALRVRSESIPEKSNHLPSMAANRSESSSVDLIVPQVEFESIGPRNREEAYQNIETIADFLITHEPHSPVPYILKYIVSLEYLTLSQLEQQLRHNGSNLSVLIDALGMEMEDASMNDGLRAES